MVFIIVLIAVIVVAAFVAWPIFSPPRWERPTTGVSSEAQPRSLHIIGDDPAPPVPPRELPHVDVSEGFVFGDAPSVPVAPARSTSVDERRALQRSARNIHYRSPRARQRRRWAGIIVALALMGIVTAIFNVH